MSRAIRHRSSRLNRKQPEVCELDSSKLADPSSRACKDTCIALYQQLPRQGHPPLLTFQEESDIADWAVRMGEKKMARNKHQICARILKIAMEKHKMLPATQEMPSSVLLSPDPKLVRRTTAAGPSALTPSRHLPRSRRALDDISNQ